MSGVDLEDYEDEPVKGAKESKLKAVDDIYKAFGAGAIMRLGSSEHQKVDVIPSSSALLDEALGVGGYPRGRFTEIFGPESSGKTTLCLHAVAEAQRMGLLCAYIDAEHSLDPTYARALGVNIDDLWMAQPDTGEQGLEIAQKCAATGEFGLILIDSIAALTPKAEIEGSMGDSHVGLHARLMSQAMRKLNHDVKLNNVAVLMVNQLRFKIGVVYGSPEVTPGGEAVKYYSSVRLDVRKRAAKADQTVQEGEVVANRVHVKVIKNKVAPPYRECDLKIIYGEGISREDSLIGPAVEAGIIEKRGSHYYYNEEKIANGAENLRVYLKANPELTRAIGDTLAGMSQ